MTRRLNLPLTNAHGADHSAFDAFDLEREAREALDEILTSVLNGLDDHPVFEALGDEAAPALALVLHGVLDGLAGRSEHTNEVRKLVGSFLRATWPSSPDAFGELVDDRPRMVEAMRDAHLLSALIDSIRESP